MRHMTTLTYIDTVARIGSIRSAADVLSITASALNRRILAIEEELGVELFDRHANGVTLNSAGELFIHHIRTQIADLEQVRSRIADLQGNRRGHIRIGADRNMASQFLARQIASYAAEFPMVTFEVNSGTTAQMEAALFNHEVDIVMVLDAQRGTDFDPLLYFPQPLVAIVPNEHPLAQGGAVALAEAAQYPLIVPPRGAAIREKIEQGLGRSGLALQIAVECDSPNLASELVNTGIGIGVGTSLALPDPASVPHLTYVPVAMRGVSPPLLTVGQRRARSLPVAVGKFVEELRTALEAG